MKTTQCSIIVTSGIGGKLDPERYTVGCNQIHNIVCPVVKNQYSQNKYVLRFG